ncbi:tubulin--tyrosine ligase [Mycoemilia scoparia]|uniref:Tubulin--tyrosine ligase n=1 Tax=Mycoemilia scoparia TaxID=417184 RepID=A0A9W8A7C0_9FUNG|nr:tubulin--tyrosine ligase [Mycoemilia scoparia]
MTSQKFTVFLGMSEPYVQDKLRNIWNRYSNIADCQTIKAFGQEIKEIQQLAMAAGSDDINGSTSNSGDKNSGCTFFWLEYEDFDWDLMHRNPNEMVFGNAYFIRKGLIRKAQMSYNFRIHMAKNSDSCLYKNVPETWIFDLDDIDYLDEAMQECFEVDQALVNNECIVGEGGDRDAIQRFILKPSLTGRGAGIHIFDTHTRLEEILRSEMASDVEDEYNEDLEESENKNNGNINGDSVSNDNSFRVPTMDDDNEGLTLSQQRNNQWQLQPVSQIREFVIQRYIDKPLLLPKYSNRKFHIRTYVLAVGSIKVYVYKQMLALFAPESYDNDGLMLDNLGAHLTNTCLQAKRESFDEDKAVELFWELATKDNETGENSLNRQGLEVIYAQIKDTLASCFAAIISQTSTFQPWPNCMEQFGFDFLVDENLRVYLLEANAYPDFKQTGKRFEGLVEGFMESSVSAALHMMNAKSQITEQLPEIPKDLELVHEAMLR